MKKIKHILCTYTNPGSYIPDLIYYFKSLFYLHITPKNKKANKPQSKIHKSINSLLINAGKKWTAGYYAQLNEKLNEYTGIWSKPFSNAPYNDYILGENLIINKDGTKTVELLAGERYAKRCRSENPYYNDNKFAYHLDKFNFRLHPHRDGPIKIACFGCSNTFGEGLPAEETWPYFLQEKLGSNTYTCHNFGVCGASADHMCRSIYTYLQENTPSYIVCLFPDIFRNEFYDMNNQKIVTMSPFIPYKPMNLKNEYDGYTLLFNDITGLFNFVKNFKFIETMCQYKKIKFIWHTWSPTILNLNIEIINKFIGNSKNSIIEDNKLFNIVEAHKLYNLEDKARDGYHNGKMYNSILADKFANLISNN